MVVSARDEAETKCQEVVTVLVFEKSVGAYIRCYNEKCDCDCTKETFIDLVEDDLSNEK